MGEGPVFNSVLGPLRLTHWGLWQMLFLWTETAHSCLLFAVTLFLKKSLPENMFREEAGEQEWARGKHRCEKHWLVVSLMWPSCSLGMCFTRNWTPAFWCTGWYAKQVSHPARAAVAFYKGSIGLNQGYKTWIKVRSDNIPDSLRGILY